MVESTGGSHVVRVGSLDHVAVEIKPRLVGLRACAIGKDARPGDGEVVLVDPERLVKEGYVLGVCVATNED